MNKTITRDQLQTTTISNLLIESYRERLQCDPWMFDGAPVSAIDTTRYRAVAWVCGYEVAVGRGSTRKEAVDVAAQRALKRREVDREWRASLNIEEDAIEEGRDDR